MKRLLWGTILLALMLVIPISTMAEVSVNIAIPLPPLIQFRSAPNVVVMPDTEDVYVVPDIDVDVFFWQGWWWRPWEGRWYRSHYYNRGWAYYDNVPDFYYDVHPNWRSYYRDRNWEGHKWNYKPIPNRRLQRNWKSWQNNHYWDKKKTWGVRGYEPLPQQKRQEIRRQRQEQYQQRPEVQRQYRERGGDKGGKDDHNQGKGKDRGNENKSGHGDH
jgi:hypothetical protein